MLPVKRQTPGFYPHAASLYVNATIFVDACA